MNYKGNKSLAVIRAQCKEQGLELDERRYEEGGDHVVVRSTGPNGEKAHVIFNTVNGRFQGKTPDGVEFSSDDELDGTPWFDALLDFFYERKEVAAGGGGMVEGVRVPGEISYAIAGGGGGGKIDTSNPVVVKL